MPACSTFCAHPASSGLLVAFACSLKVGAVPHPRTKRVIVWILKCVALLQVIHRFYQRYTGLELERIEEETDRDNFMSPKQAQELGIIDGVILSSDVTAPTATATAVAA